MLSLPSLLILLLLGALLWPVLKDLFEKNYGTYLGAAFLATIVVFFLLRLPQYGGCNLIVSVWTVLTLPLQPLGLCLVLWLLGLLEASKKLEDDPQGKKAQESRKKVTNRLLTGLMIFLLSSMPASAEWLGKQTGQTANVAGRQGIVDYVPSARGLFATTRVLEETLPLLYHPFTICTKPPQRGYGDRYSL